MTKSVFILAAVVAVNGSWSGPSDGAVRPNQAMVLEELVTRAVSADDAQPVVIEQPVGDVDEMVPVAARLSQYIATISTGLDSESVAALTWLHEDVVKMAIETSQEHPLLWASLMRSIEWRLDQARNPSQRVMDGRYTSDEVESVYESCIGVLEAHDAQIKELLTLDAVWRMVRGVNAMEPGWSIVTAFHAYLGLPAAELALGLVGGEIEDFGARLVRNVLSDEQLRVQRLLEPINQRLALLESVDPQSLVTLLESMDEELAHYMMALAGQVDDAVLAEIGAALADDFIPKIIPNEAYRGTRIRLYFSRNANSFFMGEEGLAWFPFLWMRYEFEHKFRSMLENNPLWRAITSLSVRGDLLVYLMDNMLQLDEYMRLEWSGENIDELLQRAAVAIRDDQPLAHQRAGDVDMEIWTRGWRGLSVPIVDEEVDRLMSGMSAFSDAYREATTQPKKQPMKSSNPDDFEIVEEYVQS